MAIQRRAAQSSVISISSIRFPDPNLPPDILYPGPVGNPSAAGTTSVPFGGGIVTAAPLSSPAPTPTIISAKNPPSSPTSQVSSPATSTAAASPGLTPAKLTAAIVVPIAFLAIIIPIIVFLCLSRKRRKEEREYAAHRARQRSSSERECTVEKQQLSSAASQPQRSQGSSEPISQESQQERCKTPNQQPTRHSLGLFNFELSTPSTPTLPSNGFATPNFRLSVARALKMRRSDVAVVHSHNRSSEQSADSARRQSQQAQPVTKRPVPRDTRVSVLASPPPYASPRPSGTQAQTSHFAPLERIGTRNVTERRSLTARQLTNSAPARTISNKKTPGSQPNATPRASSEILQVPDNYSSVLTRSNSAGSSSHLSAHNNGPFSSGLPERLSDVSRLSFDASRWTLDDPQEPYRASMVSAISGDESSNMHPHQIV